MPSSSLLAMKKWIALYPEDEAPRFFGIKIDDSMQDVDDLKKAIKKEAALPDPADKIQLEHPPGSVLHEALPISDIDGGKSEKDPIIAHLRKHGR